MLVGTLIIYELVYGLIVDDHILRIIDMEYPMQSHEYMFDKHGIGQFRYKILYGLLCVISLFYTIFFLNPLTWDHHWFIQWGLYTLMLSNISPNQVTIKVVIGYVMNHVKKCEWSRWNLFLSCIKSMMSLGPSRKIDWKCMAVLYGW